MDTFESIINAIEKPEVLDISGAFGDIELCRRFFVHYFKSSLIEPNDYKHLQCYESVVSWLHDNKNKGLLISGGVGVGKSVMANRVIGELLRKANITAGNKLNGKVKVKFVRMQNVTCDVRDTGLFYKNIVDTNFNVYIFDDLGTEPKGNNYGVQFEMFPYIMDDIATYKKLAIITTNLDSATITARYSDRTSDRIIENCSIVDIDKTLYKSLRK